MLPSQQPLELLVPGRWGWVCSCFSWQCLGGCSKVILLVVGVLEGLFGAENPERFPCVRKLKPGNISLKPSLLGLDLIHWNCPQGLGNLRKVGAGKLKAGMSKAGAGRAWTACDLQISAWTPVWRPGVQNLPPRNPCNVLLKMCTSTRRANFALITGSFKSFCLVFLGRCYLNVQPHFLCFLDFPLPFHPEMS